MRIVCLPIDSRPCSTQFVRRLVRGAGSQAVFPRQEEMDHFRAAAPLSASRAFLLRELPRADAAVISLDHWCYGGLLSSREEETEESRALDRVRQLDALLARFPGVPVYLSSVILRSSISALSQADLAVYNAMTDYSVYTDRYARFGLMEDREKAQAARALIPEAVLSKALRVRRRNLAVNLRAVELAASGRVKALSLLQEDSQLYGLPRADQREIEKKIAQYGLNNVYLRNGADEAGALSAAEALWAGREPLGADIRFLGPGDFIALYEDRPFRENLTCACREIGIRHQPDSETVILVCCPPDGKQREAAENIRDAAIPAYAEAIAAQVRVGKRVYVLDVIGANGGCAQLMEALPCADGLWGYSGWNTASNAMGALLAQVVCDRIRGKRNRAFFQERLLDDYVYQAVLRKELYLQARGLGDDPFRLADKQRGENMLKAAYRDRLPALWPLARLPKYRVSLPWERFFEVRAEVDEE